MAPRSQSSRDVMRQEAKLQEMTEEVRRRELRLTSPQGRVQVSHVNKCTACFHFHSGHLFLYESHKHDLLVFDVFERD